MDISDPHAFGFSHVIKLNSKAIFRDWENYQYGVTVCCCIDFALRKSFSQCTWVYVLIMSRSPYHESRDNRRDKFHFNPSNYRGSQSHSGDMNEHGSAYDPGGYGHTRRRISVSDMTKDELLDKLKVYLKV